MFRLNRITRENYRDALTLTTDSEGKLLLQEEWLPSLAYSLVQSQFEKEWDVALIECEQLPIGYVMYGKWPEKDRYVLRRFAIDRFHGPTVTGHTLNQLTNLFSGEFYPAFTSTVTGYAPIAPAVGSSSFSTTTVASNTERVSLALAPVRSTTSFTFSR